MPGQGAKEPGVALVAAGVLAVTLQCYALYRPAGPPQPGWLPHADKIGHLLGFAVPVVLVLLTIGWYCGQVSRSAVVAVVAANAGQAVVSELVQARFYPGRSGDVADLVADGLGIALGLLVAVLVWPRWSRSRQRAGPR